MKVSNSREPESGVDPSARELQGKPAWDPGRPGSELLDALREEIAENGMPGADRLREIAVERNTTARTSGRSSSGWTTRAMEINPSSSPVAFKSRTSLFWPHKNTSAGILLQT